MARVSRPALSREQGQGARNVKRSGWSPFPHSSKAYAYPGAALRKAWDGLHRADKEPYPSAEYLAKLSQRNPALQDWLAGRGGNYKDLSAGLVNAWRLYHQGAFEDAARLGFELGPLGDGIACRATTSYATYLEQSEAKRLKLFESAMQRAEEAREAMPEHANSHYLFAYALGRYSQGISILQALTRGFAGQIKEALERTLALESQHAEAHIALGTYHAEIVNQVGSLLGGLTYGASKDEAVKHYREALRLHPRSAIARIEFAWALVRLFGGDRNTEAKKLLAEACQLDPKDAMEHLDVDFARSKYESLT
jgi:tetratricopeptide (TPR) repeat protein